MLFRSFSTQQSSRTLRRFQLSCQKLRTAFPLPLHRMTTCAPLLEYGFATYSIAGHAPPPFLLTTAFQHRERCDVHWRQSGIPMEKTVLQRWHVPILCFMNDLSDQYSQRVSSKLAP